MFQFNNCYFSFAELITILLTESNLFLSRQRSLSKLTERLPVRCLYNSYYYSIQTNISIRTQPHCCPLICNGKQLGYVSRQNRNLYACERVFKSLLAIYIILSLSSVRRQPAQLNGDTRLDFQNVYVFTDIKVLLSTISYPALPPVSPDFHNLPHLPLFVTVRLQRSLLQPNSAIIFNTLLSIALKQHS